MWIAVACVLLALASRPVAAQDDADPASTARVHWGFLHFTPSVSLSNFGTDSNVFNAQGQPQRDFTAAFGPNMDLWMNVGRTRLSGRLSAQYVHFQTFENQRSLNTVNSLQWDFPLGRLTPFVGAAYTSTRNRRSFEIDTRPRGTIQTYTAGTVVRLSSRTSVVLSGGRTTSIFGQGELFRGADLTTLNQESTFARARVRYGLTPLTTFVVDAQAIQDRFRSLPLRDADSIRVMSGFELKPAALISGSAIAGVRRFTPLQPEVPRYQGIISSVDTRLVIGSRLINASVNRDIMFSYLLEQPYYLLTDSALSLTQRIFGSWDLLARLSWQVLDYQTVVSNPDVIDRTDRIRMYTGGLGYRLGRTMRLGFNVSEIRRRSSWAALRDYTGVRMGISIDYGTNQ